MSKQQTEMYIKGHIKRVQNWLFHFAIALYNRGVHHDQSKLQSPELEGWTQMDKEPRYPYGTKEYNEKKKRYAWLFEEHYKHNRHHPEYFDTPTKVSFERDLVDLIEMLCDWLGYRESIRYAEASTLVDQQCKRYGFSSEIKDLLLNTLKNYFVDFGLDKKKTKIQGYSKEGGIFEEKKHVIDMEV